MHNPKEQRRLHRYNQLPLAAHLNLRIALQDTPLVLSRMQ
jgi:hypothetical protein